MCAAGVCYTSLFLISQEQEGQEAALPKEPEGWHAGYGNEDREEEGYEGWHKIACHSIETLRPDIPRAGLYAPRRNSNYIASIRPRGLMPALSSGR